MARRRLLTLTAATLAATALALPAAADPVGDLLGEVEEAAEPVTSEVDDATGLDPGGDVIDAVEDATAPLEPVTQQAESLVDDLVGDDPGPEPDDAGPGDDPSEASPPSPEAAPGPAAAAPGPADSPSTDTGVQAAGVGDPLAFDPTRVGLSRRSVGQDPLGSSSSQGKVETPQVAPADPEPAPAESAAPAAAPSGPATPAPADHSVFLEVLAALLLAGTATTWHRLRPRAA